MDEREQKPHKVLIATSIVLFVLAPIVTYSAALLGYRTGVVAVLILMGAASLVSEAVGYVPLASLFGVLVYLVTALPLYFAFKSKPRARDVSLVVVAIAYLLIAVFVLPLPEHMAY